MSVCFVFCSTVAAWYLEVRGGNQPTCTERTN